MREAKAHPRAVMLRKKKYINLVLNQQIKRNNHHGNGQLTTELYTLPVCELNTVKTEYYISMKYLNISIPKIIKGIITDKINQ